MRTARSLKAYRGRGRAGQEGACMAGGVHGRGHEGGKNLYKCCEILTMTALFGREQAEAGSSENSAIR